MDWNKLIPIEQTPDNPAIGAKLNLQPDQKIPDHIWAMMAGSGSIQGYKVRTFSMSIQRIHDFGIGLFLGLTLGLVIAATINEFLKGLL